MSERNTIDILMKGMDRTGDYNTYSKYSLPSIAIPTAMASYITVTRWRPGPISQYLLTLTNAPLTITDALAYSGTEIIDMAYKCFWQVMMCSSTLAFTTTSALASTLNASKTVSYGLGSVTASSTTLATTMINVNPGTGQSVPTFTSSATISVAGTAVTSTLASASAILDGTATAGKIFLNLGVGTGTDIDGDATLTVSGQIILSVADWGTYTTLR